MSKGYTDADLQKFLENKYVKIAKNSIYQPDSVVRENRTTDFKATVKENLTVEWTKSRYRSQSVTIDGIRYDSKKEFARWQQLCMLRDAGKIIALQRQVAFELAPAVILDGRKKPPIRYIADAVYFEQGTQIIEDIKSEITRKDPVYRLKKHLMKSVHGIDITET